jgi:hypothetical protein
MSEGLMRIIFTFIFTCLFFVSTSSVSQAAEGCNPNVRDAQKAKAEVHVTNDVAVTEEIVKQNDSVLALTCFDQASRVSAAEGGSIFSGDFTNVMNDVVNDPLTNLLSSNFMDSIGKSPDWSGIVDTAINDLLSGLFPGFFPASSFDCTVMQDLWDDILTTGINGNTPFLTFDELLAAGGSTATNFLSNINAETGGALQRAQNAIAALPVNTIPSFVGTQTLTDVMTAAGY